MTVPHVLLAEQSFVDLAAFGDTDKARGNLRNPILRSCRVAATANVASLSGTTTIDGIALAAGDPVLLTGQTTGSQNGPWVVQTGAWTRPGDYASTLGALSHARSVLVWAGSTTANKGLWTLSTVPTTVDTTATTWAAPPTGGGGGGTNYQTFAVGGSAQTQRPTGNFIAGTGVSITPADNSGASRTDFTFAFTGGGAASPNPQPTDQGLLGWSADTTGLNTAGAAPGAGVLQLSQIPVRSSTTFGTVWLYLNTIGVGTVNAFVGLYVVSGSNLQLIGSSADQSTAWTTGSGGTVRNASLTVQASQSLTQATNVYVGFLIGTQGGTAVKLATHVVGPTVMNIGLTAGAAPLRVATFGSAQTALPVTAAIASLAFPASNSFWAGVS